MNVSRRIAQGIILSSWGAVALLLCTSETQAQSLVPSSTESSKVSAASIVMQEEPDPAGAEQVQLSFCDRCCSNCQGGPAACPACDYNARYRFSFWVRSECLLWWTKGMSLPPLVTTGAPEDGGVLGRPDTSVLLPDGRLYDQVRWAGRLRVGSWLDQCQRLGVEGEYLVLGRPVFRSPSGNRRRSNLRPMAVRSLPVHISTC